MDIDVAVGLELAGVDDLVAAVADEYYVSEDMVRDAWCGIRRSTWSTSRRA